MGESTELRRKKDQEKMYHSNPLLMNECILMHTSAICFDIQAQWSYRLGSESDLQYLTARAFIPQLVSLVLGCFPGNPCCAGGDWAHPVAVA